ncbi:hypothetical protein RRG08_052741 [Elysia crispata]|uniref:Uncharacterized protein n=1 Tax=Elysia crispata TaxID=231223 RepID=A0AAE1EAH4_9GAST|nr:hypothetical protein RRG08_052741 [Elysia crispata]
MEPYSRAMKILMMSKSKGLSGGPSSASKNETTQERKNATKTKENTNNSVLKHLLSTKYHGTKPTIENTVTEKANGSPSHFVSVMEGSLEISMRKSLEETMSASLKEGMGDSQKEIVINHASDTTNEDIITRRKEHAERRCDVQDVRECHEDNMGGSLGEYTRESQGEYMNEGSPEDSLMEYLGEGLDLKENARGSDRERLRASLEEGTKDTPIGGMSNSLEECIGKSLGDVMSELVNGLTECVEERTKEFVADGVNQLGELTGTIADELNLYSPLCLSEHNCSLPLSDISFSTEDIFPNVSLDISGHPSFNVHVTASSANDEQSQLEYTELLPSKNYSLKRAGTEDTPEVTDLASEINTPTGRENVSMSFEAGKRMNMTQTLEKELNDRMDGTSEQVQTGNILEVPGGKNRTVTDSHTLCVSRTCESGDASSINVTNKNVTPVVNTVNPRAHAGGNATAPENQTQPTITIDPEIRSEEDTRAANNQNQCVNGSDIREDENVTVNREQNKTIRRTEAMIEDGSNIPEEDVTSSRSQPETIQPSVESANSNTGLDTKNLGKGKMKRKRELGESYMGRQLDKRAKTYIPTERMQKVLGNRCDCKASHHRCRQIADVRREEIHKETWSLSWEQKRVFVKTAVESLTVKQRKTNQESRRKASLVYYLKDQGGLNDFGNLKSIKPGKKATAPNVTNLRALKYTPDGSMFFKTSFADDWELLPLPRNDVIPVNGPDRLYSSRLKIKQSKYDHLQSLKSVFLKDAHAFYDNLPH